MVNFENKD